MHDCYILMPYSLSEIGLLYALLENIVALFIVGNQVALFIVGNLLFIHYWKSGCYVSLTENLIARSILY